MLNYVLEICLGTCQYLAKLLLMYCNHSCGILNRIFLFKLKRELDDCYAFMLCNTSVH